MDQLRHQKHKNKHAEMEYLNNIQEKRISTLKKRTFRI